MKTFVSNVTPKQPFKNIIIDLLHEVENDATATDDKCELLAIGLIKEVKSQFNYGIKETLIQWMAAGLRRYDFSKLESNPKYIRNLLSNVSNGKIYYHI